MTTQVQRRRGTTVQHSTFTGAEGELTVDTTKDTVVVHDGNTAGGIALAREDLSNVDGGDIATAVSGETLSSIVITSADINGGTIDGASIGGSSAAAITGTTITGTSFVSSGDMTFGDNDKAIFGAGSDLQIYHNGSHSYISDQGTGNMLVLADNFEVNSASNTANKITATTGGAVTLFHNNAAKLATTSTGIDVTGTVTADGLTVDGTGTSNFTSTATSPVQINGTTIPTLTIRNSTTPVETQIRATTTEGLVRTATNHPLVFATNAAERMRIDSSGNVGIGTSSPSSFLHINSSNSTNTTYLKLTQGSLLDGVKSDQIKFGYNDSTYSSGFSFAPAYGVTDNNKAFWMVNESIKMTVTGSGNVGVGTSSPSTTLEIQAPSTVGGIKLRGRSGANDEMKMSFSNSTGETELGRIYCDSANYLSVGTTSSLPFVFTTAGTERMRIDSSGNLRVGVGNTFEPTIQFTNSGRVVGNPGYSFNGDLDTGMFNPSTQGTIAFANNGSESMRIDSSGAVLVGTTTSSGNKFKVERTDNDNAIAEFKTNNASADVIISSSGGYGRVRATGTNELAFLNAGTEAMRIDSSGRVGIGTSSPLSFSSGAYNLVVSAASGSNCGITINNDGTSDLGSIFFANGTSETGKGRIRYDHSSDSLAISTLDTERMRIDSSGNLLVGTTSTDTSTNAGVKIFENGTIALVRNARSLIVNRLSTDGDLAEFRKDGVKVGSIGVAATDRLYLQGGASSSILIDGYLGPGTASGGLNDNVMDCGISSARWDDVYATNGTIQTSDRNEKQDIEELSEAETRVAIAAKGLLKKFRWKDAVAEKGDEARIHFGIIAQDLQAAFETEGLDAGRYAMFIHSTWWETYTDVPAVEAVDAVYETQTDEEGNEVQVLVSEAVEAKEAYTRTDTYDSVEEAPEGAVEKSRMGVRYSELLAFIIAAM